LARERFLRHKPDLILVGLRLSGADGTQLIKEFRSLNPADGDSPEKFKSFVSTIEAQFAPA
jgi:CheY-like chemotaxis protein